MSVTDNAAAAGAPTPANIPTSHPRGLAPIFMTEMWERFSYYGMRALLVGYMVQYHGWLPSEASKVYKWYTSLVYLTPLLGGLLADRFLGLRATIITGASLMAVGHFLMAIEDLLAFYCALGCLIAGNGFFKPNMSTLVGRMYFKNDPRRDGAFTIFYMGINLGAFLSPLVCSKLKEEYNYHWGFAAAGVGMALGLAWFLLQQRQIESDVAAVGNDMGLARREPTAGAVQSADPDEEKPGVAGLGGLITKLFPILFSTVAVVVPAWYVAKFLDGEGGFEDVIMTLAYGAVFLWMSVTLWSIRGAARDKSTCIFLFFLFAVLFWMAFEQAGNSLNLWALYNTRLDVFGIAYPAEWWQSVNAVLIVAIAPLAAMLWSKLGPYEPSTAMKMLLGLGFMVAAFGVMVVAAKLEDQTTTTVACASVPSQFQIGKEGELTPVPRDEKDEKSIKGPIDAGRLRWDASRKELVKQGVLGEYDILNMLYRTCPASWEDEVLGAKQPDGSRKGGLEEHTKDASAENPVRKTLTSPPAGFRLALPLEDSGVAWDEPSKTLTFTKDLDQPTLNRLLAFGGDATLRDALYELAGKSVVAQVSGFWLFLLYLLMTLGELCLSPVGLSMVTKLAPLRFASLFMGVWLLSSSVAQYAGGTIGEEWGKVSPTFFFLIFVFTSLGGFVLLLLLVSPIKKMMHDVR